jgi:potassium-transporting ATPase KdpC subunit
MNNILTELRISVIATLLLAVILCGAYPLLIWGTATLLFPYKAEGSLIVRDSKVIGSELIAQHFSEAKYFHPRPSAAGDTGYDAAASGGSNLGPISKKLVEGVRERVEQYRTENNLALGTRVPADAVTASASGLDPHISVRNADLQSARVAQARGLTEETVKKIVAKYTEGRDLGFLGEKRVNVLKLNLALDGRR